MRNQGDYVLERFKLRNDTVGMLQKMEPEFGYNGFGEFVFYRTYSRQTKDGRQESWADCVQRVVEGTLSIRKDWYIKNRIEWNERYWQEFAFGMATSLFEMKWMPPGRGLWAMGTDFIYERGSMALYNCAYTDITNDLGSDIEWLMDSLMNGVGVGFGPIRDDSLTLHKPCYAQRFVIEDTRESWCLSVRLLIEAYLYDRLIPEFDYSFIRPAGSLIRGFGGIASGPDPLKKLHQRITQFCERYIVDPNYDSVMLKTDIANAVGCCVVAGNVRRSAEIALAPIDDPVFLDLKDYEKHGYRAEIGWMSNNSVMLSLDKDFDKLGLIADRVIRNGEPGFLNLRNFPYGRLGRHESIQPRKDVAHGINPCQPGWAKVLTPLGIREFKDIKIGDKIWSADGWTKVIDFWSTGINNVYKYKTTAGIFYGTEHHRVVCDYMKVPVKDAYGIDIIPGCAPAKELDEYDYQSVVDGLVLGDGTIHGDTLLLVIGEHDKDYFTDYVKNYIGSPYSKDNHYKVVTTLNKEEIPHTYLRKVPARFINGNLKTGISFLRGLYSANGSIVGNRVTLKASSLQVIEDVQLMLSSIGIRSYYTTNKEKDVEFENGKYTCKQSYDLSISVDRELFAEHIGFIQRYKNQNLIKMINETKHSKAKQTYDIIEVELVSTEETFEITVDNGSHTYWTQGCNVSNCGEIPLEHREVCNVAETCPTRCYDENEWYKACEYATFYTSTVSLLPTHQPSTNAVVARNRRIGVSIIDFTGWKHEKGLHKVIKYLRRGYNVVTETNKRFAAEAGVPESIRKTTIKPGGTVPKLVGKTPGAGYPTFRHTLRRVRVQQDSPIATVLKQANVPYEKDAYSDNTDVFEFPILQGPAKPAAEVTLWEQAMNLVILQREWSDNAVSNTLYFKPKWVLVEHIDMEHEARLKMYTQYAVEILNSDKNNFTTRDFVIKVNRFVSPIEIDVYEYNDAHEEDDIEPVLAAIAPSVKSVSLLPHTASGVYVQMPEEGISEAGYRERLSDIRSIDWSQYNGGDGMDEKYCDAGHCTIKSRE